MSEKLYATPIKVVIWDNDGTLMDTEWAYSWAHKQLTGEDMTWDIKPTFMGKSSIETCRLMVEKYHMDITPEDLVIKRTEMLEECWAKVELLPGAKELVETLKKMNIRMAIATSSRRHVYNQKSANHQDFVAQMDHVICGNEVQKGKPAPDIFLAALHKFDGVKPEEALVFEDSPLGIRAANDAGIPSIFIPDPNMNVENSLSEQNAKPFMIIPSLTEFPVDKFNWAQRDQ